MDKAVLVGGIDYVHPADFLPHTRRFAGIEMTIPFKSI